MLIYNLGQKCRTPYPANRSLTQQTEGGDGNVVNQPAKVHCLFRIRFGEGREKTTPIGPQTLREEELFRVVCICREAGTVIVIVNQNPPEHVNGSFEDVTRICEQRFEKELVEHERGRKVVA